MDGEVVFSLRDCQLYKLLSGKDSRAKVVVLRACIDRPDVESLRDDFSLALMELESAQNENQQLATELERFVIVNRALSVSVLGQQRALS